MAYYPNMSYCMCENTLGALRQVVEAMKEEGPQFLLDMTRHERWAFQELFSMCEEFMNLSDDLQEQVDQMASGFDEKTEEIN
jgi:hypothetical protein